jgi:hypothetical protein
LVQAFLKKWRVESDFKAPNLHLSLRLKWKELKKTIPLFEDRGPELRTMDNKVTRRLNERDCETELELKVNNKI